MTERSDLYAEALLAVVAAEGQTAEVPDELFRFARVIEANDELRDALGDPHVPAARRQQVVEDLLAGKASDLTVGIVSLLVSAGRIRELPTVVDKLLALGARGTGRVLAEVRSAVELTDDQRARLADALKESTGQDVDVIVTVDPNVVGGVVTTIGDTVIDGSIRSRLAALREAF